MNVRLNFEEIFGTAVTVSNTRSVTITALQNFFCPQVRLLSDLCPNVSVETTILRNFKTILYQWKQKASIQKDEDMGIKPKNMEVLWKASRTKKNSNGKKMLR